MADPRLTLVIAMGAAYYAFGTMVYCGRKTAAATTPADRERWLDNHRISLYELLGATLLFLVLVLMLVPSALPHGYSGLFWTHETLDGIAALLALLAIIYDGTWSPWHKYIVYPLVGVVALMSVTGNILLYQLRF